MSAPSPHVAEDLPLLLTGDAPREAVQAAADHLRGCDDCRQELVAAVTAHAALTSAHRFAADLVTPSSVSPGGANPPLPDLGTVFDQVREEVAARPPRRSRVRVFAATAVAAGVLLGAGAVALVELGAGSGSGAHNVALAPFGAGKVAAKATLDTNGRMSIDATALPALDATHRYEVWLTDDTRTRMQPIGWIDTDGTTQLTVPRNLLQSYRDIEVSVQQVDAATYVYSGTSVLRGMY
jgi:Anti-sigma-K factor rskA